MVMPEREVPGTSAIACATPINAASRQLTEYSSRCLAPEPVRDPQENAEAGERRSDQ